MHKSAIFMPAVYFLFLSCTDRITLVNPAIENITETVYASGIIKSRDQYEVFSAVNGLVMEKLVSEGDLVRRNQPIIRLSDLTARLNEENARVAVEHNSVSANKFKLE